MTKAKIFGRRATLVSLVALLVVVMGIAAGCDSPAKQEKEQAKDNLEKGQLAVPVGPMDYFLAREALRFWRDTMNVPSKLWYVYRVNDLVDLTPENSNSGKESPPGKIGHSKEGSWHGRGTQRSRS